MSQHAWPADAELVASSWMAEGQRPAADAPACPTALQRRISAAVDAGFTGIGLNRADYEAQITRHTKGGLARMLADGGLQYIELETVTGWWSDDPDGTIWRRAFDGMLAMNAAFPVRQIKLNGDFGDTPPSVEMMRDGFARLAEGARAADTVAGLEPVVFSNIRDPQTARTVVAESAGHGGGVVLDCWHLARLGLPPEELGGLAADGISGIEFSNIGADIVGSLFEDTVDHRRLPDDGQYNVAAFIRAVAATGYSGPVGCEVLSVALRELPIEDALKTAAKSARNVLTQAATKSA